MSSFKPEMKYLLVPLLPAGVLGLLGAGFLLSVFAGGFGMIVVTQLITLLCGLAMLAAALPLAWVGLKDVYREVRVADDGIYLCPVFAGSIRVRWAEVKMAVATDSLLDLTTHQGRSYSIGATMRDFEELKRQVQSRVKPRPDGPA